MNRFKDITILVISELPEQRIATQCQIFEKSILTFQMYLNIFKEIQIYCVNDHKLNNLPLAK